MDTMTSTATRAVSGVKLAIATFALFGAGAVALAAVPANFWSGAVDSDAKSTFDTNQLFVKSTTKYNGGSKTDYCYTFPTTKKTYLMEGISNKGNFQTWQKNCAELNFNKPTNNYQCVDGACVNKALLSDLVIKDVKFDADASGQKWMHIIVANEGQGASQSVGAKFGEDPVANPGGLKLTWKDDDGTDLFYNSFYLDEFAPGQIRVYDEWEQDPEAKLLITLDPLNKVIESNETNNTWFRDSAPIQQATLIVAKVSLGGSILVKDTVAPIAKYIFTTNNGGVKVNSLKFNFNPYPVDSKAIPSDWRLKAGEQVLAYGTFINGEITFMNLNWALSPDSNSILTLVADTIGVTTTDVPTIRLNLEVVSADNSVTGELISVAGLPLIGDDLVISSPPTLMVQGVSSNNSTLSDGNEQLIGSLVLTPSLGAEAKFKGIKFDTDFFGVYTSNWVMYDVNGQQVSAGQFQVNPSNPNKGSVSFGNLDYSIFDNGARFDIRTTIFTTSTVPAPKIRIVLNSDSIEAFDSNTNNKMEINKNAVFPLYFGWLVKINQ